MIPSGTTRQVEFSITYSSTWSVVAKQGDAVEAADVTDATFLLKKRLSDTDAEAKVTKETADIALASGTATVTLLPADTKDLQGDYFASLRLYLTDGTVQDFESSDLPYISLTFTQGAVESVAA